METTKPSSLLGLFCAACILHLKNYRTKMQTSEPSGTATTGTTKISSDKLVDVTIQSGVEDILGKTAAGFVVGGLAGLVLSRVGAPGARRVWAGLGAGIGLGSGWARTSIELEKLVGSKDN